MTRTKAIAAFIELALDIECDLDRLYRAPADVLGPDLYRFWAKFVLAKSPKVIARFQDDAHAAYTVERSERKARAAQEVTLTPYGRIASLVSALMPRQRERIREALEDWEQSVGAQSRNLSRLRAHSRPRGTGYPRQARRVTAITVCGIPLPNAVVRWLYPD